MNWIVLFKLAARHWVLLAAVGLLGLSWAWADHRATQRAQERQALVDSAYARGHREARGEAAVRALALTAEIVTLKIAKDSVVRSARALEHRATTRATTLRAHIEAVPPAVRDSHPAVDRALAEAGLLAADVERLTEVRVVERQAFETVLQASDSLLRDQVQLGIQLQADNAKLVQRIVVLERRPRWRTVVQWTVTGLGAGLAAGKYLLGGDL